MRGALVAHYEILHFPLTLCELEARAEVRSRTNGTFNVLSTAESALKSRDSGQLAQISGLCFPGSYSLLGVAVPTKAPGELLDHVLSQAREVLCLGGAMNLLNHLPRSFWHRLRVGWQQLSEDRRDAEGSNSVLETRHYWILRPNV